MSESKTRKTFDVMPVEIYVGGCGHVVICQEWSTQEKESYLRVMVDPRDAEKVAMQIMETARKASGL